MNICHKTVKLSENLLFSCQPMLKLTTQYGFHELFTVVYFDGKNGNLFLRMRAMSHTSYAAKFEQMITHQHVLLQWESQSY